MSAVWYVRSPVTRYAITGWHKSSCRFKLPLLYHNYVIFGPARSSHMHAFIETQKAWMRTDLPPFRSGDTLRVNVRVKEGDKERIQAFEGVCIARRGSGVSETFTVRKISNGVGVERIFPVHSPMIGDIQVVRRGRVRRAKLYYLRQLTGKATRIKEKKVRVVVPTTGTSEDQTS